MCVGVIENYLKGYCSTKLSHRLTSRIDYSLFTDLLREWTNLQNRSTAFKISLSKLREMKLMLTRFFMKVFWTFGQFSTELPDLENVPKQTSSL